MPELLRVFACGAQPVSYTHLDVYKRQTQDAAGMIAEGRAIYALDPAHMVVKLSLIHI